MYANLAMELDVAKYILSKKALNPCDKRAVIKRLQNERPNDISKSCRILKISGSSHHYQSVKEDSTIVEQLQKPVKDNPKEGMWMCYYRLRSSGNIVNHKRVHRTFKQMGLSLGRKVKKHLLSRVKEPLAIPQSFTHLEYRFYE